MDDVEEAWDAVKSALRFAREAVAIATSEMPSDIEITVHPSVWHAFAREADRKRDALRVDTWKGEIVIDGAIIRCRQL